MDNCQQAIDKLLRKEFGNFTGLPAGCDLTAVSHHLKLEESAARGLLGTEARVAHSKGAQVAGYSEPVVVWFDGERVLKIQVHYPALPETQTLLERLGEPEAKLDYYYMSIPKLNRGGEWVWASRGLTLFLSTDRSNVVDLAIYPSTTVERYRAELHVEDAPEER